MVQIAAPWNVYRVPDTLPDDTEESVVGTEWHQEATGDTADKLREGARRQAAPWGVCEQIALVGLRHRDGRPYDPRPDVMVLSRPLLAGSLSSVALAEVGAPLFIAEVASRSTVSDDVGDKRHAYEAIGAQEYVVFDPDGALLSAPLFAWRLEHGAFIPWQPDAEGWWRSAALGLSFRHAHPLLRMRDHVGREIPPTSALHILLEGAQTALEGAQTALEEERRQRAALDEELRHLRGERAP